MTNEAMCVDEMPVESVRSKKSANSETSESPNITFCEFKCIIDIFRNISFSPLKF